MSNRVKDFVLDQISNPINFADVIRYGNFTFNEQYSREYARLTSIDGLSGADIRDSREVVPGADGEFTRRAYQGGRTVVLEGELRAGNLHSLMNLREELQADLNHLKDKELWFNRYDYLDNFYQPVDTTNLITNPSFELTTSPWTQFTVAATSPSLTLVTGDAGVTNGTTALRVVATSGGSGYATGVHLPVTKAGLIPVTPGRYYTILAHSLTKTALTGAQVGARIDWYDSALNFISTSPYALWDSSTAATSRWHREHVLAPSNAFYARPLVINQTTQAGAGTLDVVWDSIGFFNGFYRGDYFDGDTAGHSWLSEPNASASAPNESISISSVKRYPNYVNNGDFEKDTTNWTKSDSSLTLAVASNSTTANGSGHLGITSGDSDGGDHYIYQRINSVPLKGKTVTLSAWYYKPTGFILDTGGASYDRSVMLVVDDGGGGTISASATINSLTANTWTRVSCTLSIPSVSTLIEVRLYQPGDTTAATVFVDRVRLEEGSTAKTDPDPVANIQQIAPPNSPLATTPRPDVNKTGILNMVTNPSIELSSAGYTTEFTGWQSVSRIQQSPAYGEYALRAQYAPANGSNFGDLLPPIDSRGRIVPGKTYTFSVRHKTSVTNGGALVMIIEWFSSTGVQIGSPNVGPSYFNNTITPRVMYVSSVAPPGADYAKLRIRHWGVAGALPGDIYYDGFQFTEGEYGAYPYFDGDIDGEWGDAPHASRSELYANEGVENYFKPKINLVPNSSFEGNSTSGWQGNNGNLTAATGVSGTLGSYALRNTATSNGPFSANTLHNFPVQAGKTYTAIATMLSQTGGRSYRLDIDWFAAPLYGISAASGGVKISTTSSEEVTASGQHLKVTATPPAGAQYAGISLTTASTGAAGDLVNWDMIGFYEGNYSGGYTGLITSALEEQILIGARVFNGQLIPTNFSEKILLSRAGPTYKNLSSVIKWTPGSSTTPSTNNIIKQTLDGDQLRAGVSSANTLAISYFDNYSRTITSLNASTSFTPVIGKSYWIKSTIVDDLVKAELWDTVPISTGTPLKTATYLLAVGSGYKEKFGLGTRGYTGFQWTPVHLADRIDGFELNSIDPSDLILRSVRKTAALGSREQPIGLEYRRPFQVSLRSSDPKFYSHYLEDQTYTVASDGLAFMANNYGNVDSYPIFSVIGGGYLKDLVITNDTTGQRIVLSGAIAQKDHLVIDLLEQKTYWNNGSSAGYVLAPSSERMRLSPGANAIRVTFGTYSSSPTSPRIRIRFRSAWA